MAVRKATVNLEDLPGRNPETGNYQVRYRIITDDRNRVSEWSPVFEIHATPVADLIANSSVDYVLRWATENGRTVYTLLWEAPEIINRFPYLDLFIKWNDTGNYTYHGSTTTSSIDVIVPESIDTLVSVSFLLQVPTYPRGVSDEATIFEYYEVV